MNRPICAAILYVIFVNSSHAQLNCNIFSKTDSCYQACELANAAAEQPQGSRSSQIAFDKSIAACPRLAYAYFEKSVPYIKRGELQTWRTLIDKAVELAPDQYLGYRGWCRYQFVRDYNGAIRDFRQLRELVGDRLGYSQNGDYHLNIVEAICYYKLGDNVRAIALMERQLARSDYSPGAYDYLHLGIVMFKSGQPEKALLALGKQISINPNLADNYYYRALCYKQLGNTTGCLTDLAKAKELYQRGYRRSDPYTHPVDKVYMSEITALLNEMNE